MRNFWWNRLPHRFFLSLSRRQSNWCSRWWSYYRTASRIRWFRSGSVRSRRWSRLCWRRRGCRWSRRLAGDGHTDDLLTLFHVLTDGTLGRTVVHARNFLLTLTATRVADEYLPLACGFDWPCRRLE